MSLFVLSRLLSSLGVSRTGSASDWCALQAALYKCIDTIQYNILSCCTFQIIKRLIRLNGYEASYVLRAKHKGSVCN